MDSETKRASAVAVGVLAEAFGRKVSEKTLQAYEWGLDGLTVQQIQRAAARAIRECKFFPVPAELRELAGEGNAESRALTAWEEFSRAVTRIGAYRNPDFSNSTINATVRSLGGWEYVCSLTIEEFDKWLRKDFLKTYEAYDRRGVSEESGLPLIGFIDRENGVLASTAERLGLRDAARGYRKGMQVKTKLIESPRVKSP